MFLFANSAFYAMLNAINRQHLNAWATALAAAINIGLNLALIPLYGFLGASTATVVTEAALCTFGWWFVQRHRAELRLPVFGLVWRTLVAGLVMGVILYPLSRFSIFLAAPAGFAAYALAIYLLRAVSPEEWRLATAIVRRRNPARVPAVGGGGKA